MNVNETIRHCQSLSFYALQDFVGHNYITAYDHYKNVTNPDRACRLLKEVIYLAIASDGMLYESEWKFIASFVGGISYDEAMAECSNVLSEKNKQALRDIIRNAPRNVGEALISMCIGVLCTDGRVEGEEVNFLRSLL